MLIYVDEGKFLNHIVLASLSSEENRIVEKHETDTLMSNLHKYQDEGDHEQESIIEEEDFIS